VNLGSVIALPAAGTVGSSSRGAPPPGQARRAPLPPTSHRLHRDRQKRLPGAARGQRNRPASRRPHHHRGDRRHPHERGLQPVSRSRHTPRACDAYSQPRTSSTLPRMSMAPEPPCGVPSPPRPRATAGRRGGGEGEGRHPAARGGRPNRSGGPLSPPARRIPRPPAQTGRELTLPGSPT